MTTHQWTSEHMRQCADELQSFLASRGLGRPREDDIAAQHRAEAWRERVLAGGKP